MAKSEEQRAVERAAQKARARRNGRIEAWQQKGLCPACVNLLDADHERKHSNRDES